MIKLNKRNLKLYKGITFDNMTNVITLDKTMSKDEIIHRLTTIPNEITDGFDIVTMLHLHNITDDVEVYNDFIDIHSFNNHDETIDTSFFNYGYLRLYKPVFYNKRWCFRILIMDELELSKFNKDDSNDNKMLVSFIHLLSSAFNVNTYHTIDKKDLYN